MFHFRFNWKVTLFSATVLVLFVNLGFWQLRRADEKVHLLKREAERKSLPPRLLSGVSSDPAAVDEVPVILRGAYDPSRVFLLDNRVLDGRVGFEVLVPFHDQASGQEVLVNRGFVPMGRTRSDLPRIPPLAPGSDTAVGNVHLAKPGVGQPALDTSSVGPGTTIIEVASPALVSRVLGKAFFPHTVRLAKSDPNALPRFWPVTVMMPSRHRAYAVQWFLMAVAVVGAWSAFSFRRHEPTEKS